MCTLYERIISLCKERGITGGKMCTDMHMSKSTLTDLKMGRQTGLSATKAQKIANYLGVTVGYLLGEEEEKEEKPKTIDEQLTGIDFAMWSETKDMTDEEKQDILNYIKFKKSQRNE